LTVLFEAPGVLSGDQIRGMLENDPPLISGWSNVDEQVQPNGFDLTLAEIAQHGGAGTIGVANEQRVLPALTAMQADDGDYFTLGPGIYHAVFAETVALPRNLMALGRARSSLNRSGVTIHTAVWDAGYIGRSTALLSVLNPHGFRVQRGARVLQLVFFGLAQETAHGYRGVYQGENT
jgi:dUTP pyrophosphatase